VYRHRTVASIGQIAFLGGAGLAAGIVGTAGGITSLISYPALLAVGIPPFGANLTNSVSLIASGLASSLSSGPELHGHAANLRSWATLAVAGGTLGACLLLVTPPGIFSWIVPFLITAAAVLLLLQPSLTARHGDQPHSSGVVGFAVFAVSTYSGYFGAGAGVLITALLMLLVAADIRRANALKNALLTMADTVPGVIFAIVGPVTWWAAVALALGASAGGVIGPVVTRRLPPGLLRKAVAVMGLGLAGWLVIQASRR
jgi:uncharacterized membrane protein YfcA